MDRGKDLIVIILMFQSDVRYLQDVVRNECKWSRSCEKIMFFFKKKTRVFFENVFLYVYCIINIIILKNIERR